MPGRKWCPTHWADEAVPISVDHPSHALRVGAGGGWVVVTSKGEPLIEVAHGDVVEWSYFESRGRTHVEKREDGTYAMGERPAGSITHWWMPGDVETVSGTLDQLVTDCLEAGEGAEVQAYYWSGAIPFQLEVDGPGRAVFEPLEADRRGGRRG